MARSPGDEKFTPVVAVIHRNLKLKTLSEKLSLSFFTG